MAARNKATTSSILSLLILGLGVTAILTGCGEDQEQQQEDTPATQNSVVLGAADVATAQMVTSAAGITVNGTLEPYTMADVKSQTSGTIHGIRVNDGSPVHKGQTLGTVRSEGIGSQVTSANANVDAAESNLALAKKQLESMKNLYEAGAIARLELDNAEATVKAAESQVRSAKAQVTAASEQAGNRVVSSPITGRISKRIVNEGEAVSPGQKLFTVVNTSILELAGQVPAEKIGQIKVGQSVALYSDRDPDTKIEGKVARINPVADPATRQVTVWIQVNNSDGSLVGGQFVSGRILSGETKSAVTIPTAALREAGGRNYVLVIRDGTFQEKDVKPGDRDERRGTVEIISGISAGDNVLTAPATNFDQNANVQIAGETRTAATDADSAHKEVN